MQNNNTMQSLDQFFHISKRGSTLKREMVGGITTFLTMSYIIFVNPSILEITGMDKNALISVTCIVSAFGTLLMAFMANMPIVLAPGMGLNAFFTFSLVMGQGVSWQVALGVVFLSGVLFCILALSGVRQQIAKSVPHELIMSATSGIGLFITFIGLKNMGIIVANPETLVTLGEFNATVCLSLFGLIMMVALEVNQIKGGMLIGIIVTSILGIFVGLIDIPKTVFSLPPSITPIAFQLDIMGAMKVSLASAIFSFMFIDMFDSLAMLLSCSKQVGENSESAMGKMLYADVGATLVGATLGSSTVTSCGESVSGITAGARTGFSSIIVSFLFISALFLTPLISVVPIYVASPALVITGVYMFKSVLDIDLHNMKIAIPAFVMMIFMPLTYSISEGLAFGFLTYILAHVFTREFSKISPTMWCIGILSFIHFVL